MEVEPGEQTFYAAWVHRVSSAIQKGTAAMIHNIAEGNRTASRRSKDVEVEPGEQGAAMQALTTTLGDSCADLTEDTGTESGSEAECTAQPEGGTTTVKRGPLRTPTPSQVVMAAARARAKRMNRMKGSKVKDRTTKSTGAEGSDSNSSSSVDSSKGNSNSAVK